LRGRKRVAELLNAAEGVIAEQGYEAATMSSIAERAGASIGSLYQFFPDKQAVAQALRARHAAEYLELCSGLAAEAKSSNLETFASHLIHLTVFFFESHPAFGALLDAPGKMRGAPAIRSALLSRFSGYFRSANPRTSKVKAERLATVTLFLIKALAQGYAESTLRERGQFVTEFKVLFCSYLKLRLGRGESR
jgi:AcrR family transcriptional regulator